MINLLNLNKEVSSLVEEKEHLFVGTCSWMWGRIGIKPKHQVTCTDRAADLKLDGFIIFVGILLCNQLLRYSKIVIDVLKKSECKLYLNKNTKQYFLYFCLSKNKSKQSPLIIEKLKLFSYVWDVTKVEKVISASGCDCSHKTTCSLFKSSLTWGTALKKTTVGRM